MNELTHLSSSVLEKIGFEKIQERRWIRGRDIVTYDGAVWLLNGEREQYVQEVDKRAINRLPTRKFKSTSRSANK